MMASNKIMAKLEISPDDVVLLLNSMLALDPALVLTLLGNRPNVSNDLIKDFMQMKSDRMSFLGIINAIIRESGYMIGADCEVENGEMQYVKFFHILERTENVKEKE